MQQRGRGGGRKEKKRKKRRGGRGEKEEEGDVEYKKKRRGKKRKRGGRPRSLNCFLFLVRGNNQQLGGRLGRANFSDFWYYTLPRVILSKLGGKVLIMLFQIYIRL